MMFIELHAIQTFAPSNLNRDDTGNPKEALFGGVRRARVSSQSAKRAMRVSEVFKNALPTTIGIRTKIIKQEIVNRLVDKGMDAGKAWELIETFMTKAFAKADSKDKAKTSILIFISQQEFDWIANGLAQDEDIEKLVKLFTKEMKDRTFAPDIALFGRMLAEVPALNINAACQVAHALSTHEVATAEFDYFTAVDDLTPNDESGAGMLGLVPFNSATYYRCIRVDWNQLVQNLGGDKVLALGTVDALMKAFALVVPTGMQNSFINQHPPDFLLAVVRPNRDGQSLMNAFEKPVQSKMGTGFAEASVTALSEYWEQIEGAFRLANPVISVLNPRRFELNSDELNRAEKPNLLGWIESISSVLQENG